MAIEYVEFSPDEWQKVRDFRVRAVTDSPLAFGRTPAEEAAEPESTWRERLEKKSYLHAVEGEHIVGSVSVVPERGEKVGHIANIYGVFVAPEARGKGVAKGLISEVMRRTKERIPRIIKFRLDVGVTQKEAQGLYKSLGFEEVGVMKKELLVDGQYIDEIAMEKFI